MGLSFDYLSFDTMDEKEEYGDAAGEDKILGLKIRVLRATEVLYEWLWRYSPKSMNERQWYN